MWYYAYMPMGQDGKVVHLKNADPKVSPRFICFTQGRDQEPVFETVGKIERCFIQQSDLSTLSIIFRLARLYDCESGTINIETVDGGRSAAGSL